jgi:hypothetical protein
MSSPAACCVSELYYILDGGKASHLLSSLPPRRADCVVWFSSGLSISFPDATESERYGRDFCMPNRDIGFQIDLTKAEQGSRPCFTWWCNEPNPKYE